MLNIQFQKFAKFLGHACRKNSHRTDVVAIGQQHVTKMDDVSTQRHEFVGTERVYNDLKSRGIQ